jgi:hypothetical protein
MRFEHHKSPLLPVKLFIKRMVNYFVLTAMLLAVSLGIGVLGYHYLNEEPWLDALVDASMILTGMGPVTGLKSEGAKWFASAYAIFSGVAFLSTVAIFLSPLVHRFLHRLHLNSDEKENGNP